MKEQRETMRVRATRARHAIERAEMEDFFMQCIEVRDSVCCVCFLFFILDEKALQVTHRLHNFVATVSSQHFL